MMEPGTYQMTYSRSRYDRTYTAVCANCGTGLRFRGLFARQLPKSLRQEGWATRKGKWYCPDCKNK